jgi:hypothetical protein
MMAPQSDSSCLTGWQKDAHLDQKIKLVWDHNLVMMSELPNGWHIEVSPPEGAKVCVGDSVGLCDGNVLGTDVRW